MDNFSTSTKKPAAVAISAASGRAVSSDDSASVEAVVFTGVAGSTATGIFVEEAIASTPLRTPAKECESDPGSLGSPPEPALCPPMQPKVDVEAFDSQEKAPNKLPPGIDYEAQRAPDGRKCGDWFTDCGPAASDEWVVKEGV